MQIIVAAAFSWPYFIFPLISVDLHRKRVYLQQGRLNHSLNIVTVCTASTKSEVQKQSELLIATALGSLQLSDKSLSICLLILSQAGHERKLEWERERKKIHHHKTNKTSQKLS